MSILEKNSVDGVALANNGDVLMLLITDHLAWNQEYEHLIALQEKINAYISFWQSGQYKKVCDASRVKRCSVEIHFMYEPTENAYKFLNTVNKQTSVINMEFAVHVDKEKK